MLAETMTSLVTLLQLTVITDV